MTTGSFFQQKRCHVGERRVARLSGQSFMLADQKKPSRSALLKINYRIKKVRSAIYGSPDSTTESI